MTDGILLKEIESDVLLTQYSVIIIDEAHERSVNTDILISLISTITRLRLALAKSEREEYINNINNINKESGAAEAFNFKYHPLRLIIMSATLRVNDFTHERLFKTPPKVIKIPSRQHPVTVHFNKITKCEYVEEAFNKVCKIHRNLPDGGVLVFLTGRMEILYLVNRLKMEFGEHKLKGKEMKTQLWKTQNIGSESEKTTNTPMSNIPKHILPLPFYSNLPQSAQEKVFIDPPPNTRLIIISTNIAETSLTIPNIRYVVDTGRHKQRVYAGRSQISSFDIKYVSRASAEQRAGRAGRTAPGHAYRLYSSAFYGKLDAFECPQITSVPIEQTVLQLKVCCILYIYIYIYTTVTLKI